MKKTLRILHLVGIEIIFGGFFIIFYSFSRQEPTPLLIYFLITGLLSVLLVYLISKFENRGKWIYIFILPIILLIGVKALPLSLLLIINLILFVRTISHFNDPYKQSESFWILLSFTITAILLFITGMSDYPYKSDILTLMILQLFFAICGGFVKRWMDTEKEEMKSYIFSFLSIFTVIAVIAIIFSLSLSLLQKILFGVLQGVAFVVGTLAQPLFKWAEKFELDANISQNASPEIEENSDELADLLKNAQQADSFFDPVMLMMSLFFLGVVVTFVYFMKKKKVEKNVIVRSQPLFSKESAQITRPSFEFPFGKGKISEPNNKVRREIYEFEKFASKLYLGRRNYESFKDWMERLSVEETSFINSIYEEIRYGNGIISTSNEDRFKQEVKRTKQELKRIQRNLIQQGELVIPKGKKWSKFIQRKNQ